MGYRYGLATINIRVIYNILFRFLSSDKNYSYVKLKDILPA